MTEMDARFEQLTETDLLLLPRYRALFQKPISC